MQRALGHLASSLLVLTLDSMVRPTRTGRPARSSHARACRAFA